MSKSNHFVPPIKELKKMIRKKEYDDYKGLSTMRFIAPLQIYLTYGLLKINLNSIQVTVLWLIVAYIGYLFNTIGHPLTFIIGSVFIYIKIMLDGVDGEVARYHKQFVTPAEDAISFINGKYLDLIFHSIEMPVWGLSIAIGLYISSENPWIFCAGISISLTHCFYRHNLIVQKYLPVEFKSFFLRLITDNEITDIESDVTNQDTIVIRLIDKIGLWVKNGKLFNLIILICSLVDCIFVFLGKNYGVLFYIFAFLGIVCPFVIIREIRQIINGNVLVNKTLKLCNIDDK